ncbi:MAG: putative sporulation protein YtxC [Eubacteriales bacterium]|nr:putative sporulation protein YtxC [Eubacteriales bacterium]
MQFLNIETSEPDDEIVQYITERLNSVECEDGKFNIKGTTTGNSTSVTCKIEDSGKRVKKIQQYNSLINNVAGILADYIVKKYESRLIYRIINTNYGYFNAAEKREIFNLVEIALIDDTKSFLNNLFQVRRRNILIRKLFDYFEDSNQIILEGFVNFRLKEYMKDLEDIVDKAVDSFLIDREYREFIRLLRYFVEIQEPKFTVVHVTPSFDGKYILSDGNKNEITGKCIQELLDEVSVGEISFDDLLMSSLITLAPTRIVIHKVTAFQNKELLETIKNVFSGKVSICNNCELCVSYMVGNKNKK